MSTGTIVSVFLGLLVLAGAIVGIIYAVDKTILGFDADCVYENEEYGDWAACVDGKTTRTRKPYEGDELSHCTYRETKDCGDVDCKYSDWKHAEENEDGMKISTRTTDGPEAICKDTSKSERISNVIELKTSPDSTPLKVNIHVFDEGWNEVVKDFELKADKTYKFLTKIDPKTVRIRFEGAGNVILEDVKYNGTSIMKNGLLDSSKSGTLVNKTSHDYTIKKINFLGCYKESRDGRIMNTKNGYSRGTTWDRIDNCRKAAEGRDHKYFAIQNANECWSSNNENYDEVGESDECNNKYYGRGWVNSVFKTDLFG